jgi:hypothetical protein
MTKNLTKKQREILNRAATGRNAYEDADGTMPKGADGNAYRHVVERLEAMGYLNGWHITDAGRAALT